MGGIIVPEVRGYGDLEVESFNDYVARWPRELANFPECVIRNWVYRHWSDFKNLWMNRSIQNFAFSEREFSNAESMQVSHVGKWLETLDHWGDELFSKQLRQETWLARYMLANGTTPAPIIVATGAEGLEHPRGGPMQAIQLIEGHMRLAYLRGMIRHAHPPLKPSHAVWHLSLPREAFARNRPAGAD